MNWKKLDEKEIVDLRILKIISSHFLHPVTGKKHEFFIFDSVDWVNIIPVTPEENVVLIKQFRPGINEVTLEIPGGMIDDNETPIEAAKRELEEETGYIGKEYIYLGNVLPNPAIFNNKCHTVLAIDVEKKGNVHFDSGEYIKTEIHPLKSVGNLIKKGKIAHSLVINAFFWLSMSKYFNFKF